jgi:hypothetical protein
MKLRIGGLILFLAVVVLGAGLMFGKAISQGVSPFMSLWLGTSAVSATNPLPVTGGGGGPQPSPLYTTPVSCATPSCAVVDYQGTSPWVVGQTTGTNLHVTVDNTSPMPVTTPVPLASQSPIPWPAFAHLHVGSGTTVYLDTWADTIAATGSISTATTTLLVSGVASQTMYVFAAWFQLNGTNAALTVYLEYGQGATCGTNTVKVQAVPIPTTATTSGQMTLLYGGSPPSILASSWSAGAVPLIVPANATAYNLCVVTAGTTIAGIGGAYYAIHAN